jgi:Flp pilus assembly protein TadD
MLLFGLLFQTEGVSYDQLFEGGRAALTENRLREAQATLERAVKLKPASAEAWLALAETYRKLKQTTPAHTAAVKAEALGKGDPAILRGLSTYYSDAGDLARAADYEERYAAVVPEDRDAFPRAIALRLQARQAKLAIVLAQKAVAVEDRADLRYLLGKAYGADNQWSKAVAEFQRAILLNPYEESSYFDLGQALLDRGDFAAAVQVLEGGRKVFDKSPQIELALGAAYLGQKRFNEAGAVLLRTISLAPEAAQAYTLLGLLLDESKTLLPEITATFRTFADAHPRQYLPQFLYGKALLAQGQNLAEAEDRLRRSIVLQSGFWESHYQLGLLLEKYRNFTGAIAELKKASTLAPKSPAPHQQLARLYESMGKAAEAKLERATAQRLAGGAAPK